MIRGRKRGLGGWLRGAAAVAVMVMLGASPATAADDIQSQLARGETVTYPQTVEGSSHHYVGGVTYTVVEASPSEMSTLFEDVNAYKRVLPRTKSARLVGINGPDRFIELKQGNALIETTYTIRVRQDPDGRTVRFWLDLSKPHGIDDAWGFFRLETLPGSSPGAPRVLLTYGALVDVGPGLVRELFEERVRTALLEVPQRVRRYAAARFRTHNTV